ncbi:MAG: flagellar hook-basal body complex protein [Clostridium sp.]
MIRSLYTAVSGLITMENKQASITNNMGNANTVGYKKENLVVKSFDEVMLQNKEKSPSGLSSVNKLGTISLGAEIDDVITYFTQGDLKETGNRSDMAIDGRGFFVVQKGNERVFTRDGNFKIDNNGYLITTTGDRVLGTNTRTGNVEPIFVGNSKFLVDENNNINIDGASTHKLLTADFEDYGSLKKVGDNYYTAENPIYNARVMIHQGFVENSNVNITNEMVDMLTTMRSFETNQKFVSMLDETLGKAANEIGAVR